MKAMIRYFIKYPINGDLLMIALLVAGAAGIFRMKSTFFPETPTKTISVQAVYPGASPQEVEEGIIIKIEDNLKGLAGIDQIKSTCSENTGNITIEVLDEDETDEILQDVKNAVDRISSFPVGMEPPIIYKRDNINFAISFAVSGDHDLKTLKNYARQIETQLRTSDAISQVELSGFPDEEIEIQVNEQRLLEYGLNANEVAIAIQAANIESTGGTIKGDSEELLIRGRFKVYSARELEEVVIRSTEDGRIIRLGDIAQVTDRWSDDDPSRNWFNGKPAVVVTVNNLIQEDMLEITDLVKDYIQEYNSKDRPVQLDIVRDGSVTLNQRIDLLVENGIIGFVLVLIFLALFLNVRLAFWVALAIPVSFMGMFLVASIIGVTINVISLFGMILVIGILVDDGIVIAENIYQHYERGATRYEATINGTLEVLPAVFSAIVTTVVAFSSFYFIEGRLGDFFVEMARISRSRSRRSIVTVAVGSSVPPSRGTRTEVPTSRLTVSPESGKVNTTVNGSRSILAGPLPAATTRCLDNQARPRSSQSHSVCSQLCSPHSSRTCHVSRHRSLHSSFTCSAFLERSRCSRRKQS
ncbi:MAG: efflux RND transporter permease subunit, partial [Bacteroidota bacterium]